MSKNKSVNWAGLKQAASKVRMQATKEKSYSYAIKAPDILPGVVPKGQTAPVLAQDAVPYQQAAVMYSGGGFPGFQYLAMLASRAEFRAFASTLSTEMTREWIDFTSEQSDGSEDSEKIKAIKDEFDRLKVQEIMRRAVEHDCLYGRAQIFFDIDGQDRSLPMILDKRTIKPNSLNSISTVEAVWTTPASYNAIDPAAPDFYKPPKWFMLGQEVHSSRLMTVVTREMPDILKPAYNFAGISLSQLAEPYVDNWLRTRQSVSDLINIFSLTVLKTDMSQVLLSDDDGGSLFDRADLFTALRSNKGLMLLDKEREDVMQLNTPLSGLDKLQAQSQEQMCSVSKIPAVVLTGISPTGLNASSEGEIKGFRDWIAAQQNSFWRLPLETILKVVQLNLFGEIDPTIGIKFNPLDQMTPKEQAEIRFSDMQTDTGYIDHAVIDAQEVRKKLADDPESGYQGIDADLEIVPPMNDFDPIQSAEDKSVSEAQHKAMEAAAHGKSTLGIPKKVGEEFVKKDKE